jgi:phosphoribosylaminoimidazole-succinocarboxamide synthase
MTTACDRECVRGKVRDIYDLGDQVLIVACDRISAFDVVLPTPIPQKGVVLTAISKFWFEFFEKHIEHHLLEVVEDSPPRGFEGVVDQLRGRAMVCRKAEVVPIECVVRGYITGSGWKDYQRTGEVCGIPLPAGLQQCQQLPEPLFTPSTKATVGHDENISFEQACDLVGHDTMVELRDRSLQIYIEAAAYAAARGVIIADTKFEWGLCDGRLILIDEVLTPDSSRFWPAADFEIGRDQDSFDKQYVRNYLQTLCDAGHWDKTPPGPTLPEHIVSQTTAKYLEAQANLTGPVASDRS